MSFRDDIAEIIAKAIAKIPAIQSGPHAADALFTLKVSMYCAVVILSVVVLSALALAIYKEWAKIQIARIGATRPSGLDTFFTWLRWGSWWRCSLSLYGSK